MTKRIYFPRRCSILFAPVSYRNLFGLCATVVFLAVHCLHAPVGAQPKGVPELFTYGELTTLYEQDNIPAPLESKLNRLLTVPFVVNSHSQAEPVRLARTPRLGEFLRVAFWNIERSLEHEAVEAALGDEASFAALLNPEKYPPGSAARREAL